MCKAELIKRLSLTLATLGATSVGMPAQAQTYLHYRCVSGAEFELAFFPETRAVFLQIDGKSLNLPKRLSVTGSRYSKNGVTFWVKGDRATLKRGGKTTECTAK